MSGAIGRPGGLIESRLALIMKLCGGFLYIIVFVHDNNMFSIISWFYNNVNVMFQLM